DYGEARFKATGMIDGRLFIVIFTTRGERFRLISLRKANEREKRAWANR
ncbi:MAG: BrnT family toxin, partial [Cypionkella sp.]|nr:BrnT family toxin [Cypionkella sp.]